MNTTNFNNNNDDNNKIELEELAVLYAIGALDPEEATEAEAKLSQHPELRNTVEEMRSFDSKLSKSFKFAISQLQTTDSLEDSTEDSTEPVKPLIAQQENALQNHQSAFKFVGNIAVLALLVLIGILLLPMFTSSRTQVATNNESGHTGSNEETTFGTSPVSQNKPGTNVGSRPTLHNGDTQGTEKSLLEGYELLGNSIVECFSQDSREKIAPVVKEFFESLQNQKTVKAEVFQKISDELSNLTLEGDDENLKLLLKNIVDKVKESIEKKNPAP